MAMEGFVMRMRRLAVLVSVLAMFMAASAMPAHAEPPRSEENVFFIFPDEDNSFAVFWNTTRSEFCAWEEGGFVGPEPAIEPVTVVSIETGKGAIVESFHATRPIELWALDEDADLSGPCVDTDDQTAAWAAGDARVKVNDNDVFVSGTRTNSFGDSGRATVTDHVGGQWSYTWTFRAQLDRDENFALRVANYDLERIR